METLNLPNVFDHYMLVGKKNGTFHLLDRGTFQEMKLKKEVCKKIYNVRQYTEFEIRSW